MYYVGCSFLLLSFIFMGIGKGKEYGAKYLMLEDWYHKIDRLKSEILLMETPLPEAFLLLGKEGQAKKKTPVSHFFLAYAEMLRSPQNEEHRYEQWCRLSKKLCRVLDLTPETLFRLGKNMERRSRREQEEQFCFYLKQLEPVLKMRKEELTNKKKVAQTVFTAAGILIVLVLL